MARVGCISHAGDHGSTGWIRTVDLFGPGADLPLDLREPLPFSSNTITEIYTEHFFEHLDYPNVLDSLGWNLETPNAPSEALLFLRECRRGARSRRSHWTLSCLTPKDSLPNMSPGVRWGFRWTDGGGRSGATRRCTACTICSGRAASTSTPTTRRRWRVLQSAGFVDVVRRSYDPARDAANHVIGSLCMTGVKPGERGSASRPT